MVLEARRNIRAGAAYLERFCKGEARERRRRRKTLAEARRHLRAFARVVAKERRGR